MIPLEFTTTAMCRPEILRQTYQSFREKLLGVDFEASTVYINVDPAPDPALAESVVAAAGETFGKVISRIADRCCFPRAVQWTMEQPTAEFFFNLEDDWRLTRVMDVMELIKFLRDHPKLSVTNLRYYPSARDEVCLGPGLWRNEHAKRYAAGLSLDANPEVQLRPAWPKNPYGGLHTRANLHGKQFPGYRVLEEIGRPWLKESGWAKAGQYFTEWVPQTADGAYP